MRAQVETRSRRKPCFRSFHRMATHNRMAGHNKADAAGNREAVAVGSKVVAWARVVVAVRTRRPLLTMVHLNS